MNHFMDIGSNIGQTFTEFLAQTDEYNGWTVWCFEPSPRHIEQLTHTAEQYNDRYQINLVPCGVSGHDGLQRFYQKDDPRGDSFSKVLITDHETHNLPESCPLFVPVFSIATLMGYFIPKGEKVIIKLDCEGSEYPILRRLLDIVHDERIQDILVEWHTTEDYGSPDREQIQQAFSAAGRPLNGWFL